MSELKEHNLPFNSFIAGWYIDPKICDDLITLFKSQKEHQKPGVVGSPYNVDITKKDSIDLGIDENFTGESFVKYTKQLKEVISLYENKYRVTYEAFSKFSAKISKADNKKESIEYWNRNAENWDNFAFNTKGDFTNPYAWSKSLCRWARCKSRSCKSTISLFLLTSTNLMSFNMKPWY